MGAQSARVVVWATGWIGQIAIRSIARRADLDLVGVWVHSPEKVGKDAGELADIAPLGVAATDDADALLALQPDCVIYAAHRPERDAAAVPDYVRILEAGVNLVSVSTPGLVYPPNYDAGFVEQLGAAAERGGVSLYSSGIEPGFAADHLPLFLCTQSDRISKIHSTELFLYDTYPVTFDMFDVMGFGMPLDYQPLLATPGGPTAAWGPSIHMIADALGVEIDEFREVYERVPADRTLEVASGVIEAGTCGAMMIQTIGVVHGRDAIVIEHVNRMAPDLGPEWQTASRDGVYRVEISGNPDIRCDMALGDPSAATAAGMTSTAMRIVNAVHAVVAAPPGLLSSLDLPLTVPQNAVD
jgi:hypothetical protein